MVIREIEEILATLDLKVNEDLQDLLDQAVLMVLMVHLDLLDQKDKKGLKDHWEVLALEVNVERLVQRVLQDLLVQVGNQGS